MAIDRSKRITFEEAADLYEEIRSDYPEELVEDILSLSGIASEGRILEIGCGPGNATVSFARRGYRILGIELGERLAALAAKNCHAYPGVMILNLAFEDWEVEERALLVGPGPQRRLYALWTDDFETAIITSDDAGVTWQAFPGGTPPCIRNLNLDYATEDALYASTCDGLYHWNGREWQQVSTMTLPSEPKSPYWPPARPARSTPTFLMTPWPPSPNYTAPKTAGSDGNRSRYILQTCKN